MCALESPTCSPYAADAASGDEPTLILAAMARAPRARPRKKAAEGPHPPTNIPHNNYVAEAAPKRRPGAPKGNSNALKTGRSTAEWLAFKARMRIMYRTVTQATDDAEAAIRPPLPATKLCPAAPAPAITPPAPANPRGT